MRTLIIGCLLVILGGCATVGNTVSKFNPFKKCDPCENGNTELQALIVNYERDCVAGEHCEDLDPRDPVPQRPGADDPRAPGEEAPGVEGTRYSICKEHKAC